MVNTEDFVKRLEIILDYYHLNASTFADKIGVQRSSLSHLLSGRNKPSLDFVLKILDVFPDIDLYWILNGKGTFPKTEENNVISTAAKLEPQKITPVSEIAENNNIDLFSENQSTNSTGSIAAKKITNQNVDSQNKNEEVDKIVIFYKNGTFKSYRPS
ncbi:transcriptional regulator with XRE-family HTH domain [Flavobacterium sp. PL11]|jgi:transcriptional regulator with XRE-family HTH domain|uniref:helix-turn-helix domain-containing protein n=1 Tax=Flavobacterium sp. PL11 TaxID=3071717 RepID=UPI002E06CEF6|nr:transcriptional regulator with XRE-family HTH domain [Flavobacterium sp. PL11]